MVVGSFKWRRKSDKAFAVQCQQEFTASHILEAAVWLKPVPFLAEDSGDLRAAFVPMLVNSCLNQRKIGLVNRPFSDGNR